MLVFPSLPRPLRCARCQSVDIFQERLSSSFFFDLHNILETKNSILRGAEATEGVLLEQIEQRSSGPPSFGGFGLLSRHVILYPFFLEILNAMPLYALHNLTGDVTLGFQTEAKLQFAENCAGNHTWNVDDPVECGDDGQVEYTFFEAPLVSDEHEVTKCEQEEVLSSNFSREYTPWNSEELSDCIDYGEAYQVRSNITPQDGNDMQIVAKENPEHETSSPQELLDSQEFLSKIFSDVKNKTPVLNKMERMSTEVPEKGEKKFAKGKSRNQSPDSQTSRKPSTYRSSHSAGKTFPKELVEVERGDTQKMQPQQKFPARISQSSLDSKVVEEAEAEIKQLRKSLNFKALSITKLHRQS
ncbi:hypothetical protein MUK42_29542 [Musa troglodytarum]|uniref:Uncharacterized protein n=1 Tax=Musa troglodytarum TaxID=320322 RepID=A0A9E7G6V4_9LILI|nr:hypothetical protein MUK42_29542 [Musa troglodytarum]